MIHGSYEPHQAADARIRDVLERRAIHQTHLGVVGVVQPAHGADQHRPEGYQGTGGQGPLPGEWAPAGGIPSDRGR